MSCIAEEEWKCENCGYKFFNGYGIIQEFLLNKVFYSSYSNGFRMGFWGNIDYKIRSIIARIIYKSGLLMDKIINKIVVL